MKKYHVYAIGNALVDTEIEVTDTFLTENSIEKGLMTLVDEARQSELVTALQDYSNTQKRACGGSAANTVMAIQHFGGQAYYACKVANDDTGDFYYNSLTDSGIGTNLSGKHDDGVSGKCLVMITPDAERTMNTYLGISESISVDCIDEDAIANAEYVYLEGYLVTSPTGHAAALEVKSLAEKHNVKTALTFSDPAMVSFFKDGLKAMVGEGVDLLFCNEDEALSFSETDNIDAAAESLKTISKHFIITRGAEGALIYNGENYISITAHDVKAIDSNGAGDMFAGAYLYGLTQGYNAEKSGKLASLAASKVVSQFGPRLADKDHAVLRDSIK